MVDQRAAIFADIRASLGRGPLASPPVRPAAATVPEIGQCAPAERLSRLRTKLIAQAATVALSPSIADVPRLVAEYLDSTNAGKEARMAAHPELEALDWETGAPDLTITQGAGEKSDVIGISRGLTAMAETGTILMISGADCPVSLAFAPETHIVILRESELVSGYEGVWKKVRKSCHGAAFPRSVNFISGPSRTADIALTMELGAHGPLRFHVIVVEDGTGGGDNQSLDPSQT